MIAFGYFFNNRYALYLLDEEEGEVRKLVEFKDKVTPYIITWTLDGNYILFEKGAWEEAEPHAIWRISKTGGEPEKILELKDLFSQGEVLTIEVNPDGEQVVFDLSTGKQSEVWALKNLFKKK